MLKKENFEWRISQKIVGEDRGVEPRHNQENSYETQHVQCQAMAEGKKGGLKKYQPYFIVPVQGLPQHPNPRQCTLLINAALDGRSGRVEKCKNGKPIAD